MTATKHTASNSQIRSPSELIDKSSMSGQQILIIALCLLFNMLDGFDITAMAIVAKTVSQELALPPERLGWIFSFALAGMMAGAMFLAPISDLIGRRKMIIISLLLVGVSILFTAKANTLTEFIILRFISGLGAGSLLACQATLASEYSPERFRALAVGAVTAGYPMGAMMTSVVAGYVMPDYGWRGMFWFGGIATVLMAFLAIWLIPESLKYLVNRRPENALEKVNAQLQRIGKPSVNALPELAEQDTLNNQRGFLGNILLLLGPDYRRTTILLWLAFFFSFATLYVMLSWIPQMVEDSGYSFVVGREAFFLFNLGGVIGIFLMGLLATRFWLSNLLLAMLFGSAIGMVFFANATVEQTVMMAIIFMIGVLLQGGFTGLYAAASKAYATQIRATGLGWCLGLGRSGAVIGPTLAGYLISAQFSMSAIFYIFAAPMAIAGIIGFYLKLK